jgi:hypothetical protein
VFDDPVGAMEPSPLPFAHMIPVAGEALAGMACRRPWPAKNVECSQDTFRLSRTIAPSPFPTMGRVVQAAGNATTAARVMASGEPAKALRYNLRKCSDNIGTIVI